MMILADIGGTYARFSRLDGGALLDIEKYTAADYAAFEDALIAYCTAYSIERDAPLYIATAAYPDKGGAWVFVNNNQWRIDPAALEQNGWRVAHILNDFEAAAWGVSQIDGAHLSTIQKGQPDAAAPKCLMGPGTGLGLAYLLPTSPRYVQKTHGGHMIATAITDEQRRVCDAVQSINQTKSPLVFENLVSGAGLLNLYNALCSLRDLPISATKAQHVVEAIETEEARDALRLFHEFLGLFAHTAVTTGHAYGGVYMIGGMIERLSAQNLFDHESLRRFFTPGNVGSVDSALRNTPIYLVKDPYLTLGGLKALIEKDL